MAYLHPLSFEKQDRAFSEFVNTRFTERSMKVRLQTAQLNASSSEASAQFYAKDIELYTQGLELAKTLAVNAERLLSDFFNQSSCQQS